MRTTILSFSLLIILLLALLQFSKYTMVANSTNAEFVIAIVAVVFFFVGVYINKKSLEKRKKEEEAVFEFKAIQFGLSKREYQVLSLMAEGNSNKEIGEKLFLSESTIKTHISNIFTKLDAKRRTQAIQLAKEAGLIK